MTLDERLDKAEETIQKTSFRENKGLGNEVGYYIFDYPAEKELYIRERIDYIKKKSENSNDDYKVVVFDLYDIIYVYCAMLFWFFCRAVLQEE